MYPVCDGSADNVIGVLNAKDYFCLKARTRENIIAIAVHPAYFVPETIKADVLFRNMKESHNSMAEFLDEYGGMVGIVTILDLLEELVGDLNAEVPDEDNPEPYIEKVDEITWNVHGNISLKELEEVTGLEFNTKAFDTFTGIVFDALGAIPEDGEQNISLEISDCTIKVSKIEAHQIESAILTVNKTE